MGVNATPRPLLQEAGWALGPVWTGAENLVLTGIRSPDRPARGELPYRLRYPGPHVGTYRTVIPSILLLRVFQFTNAFSSVCLMYRRMVGCLRMVNWKEAVGTSCKVQSQHLSERTEKTTNTVSGPTIKSGTVPPNTKLECWLTMAQQGILVPGASTYNGRR
jgi:hypothetical protein